MSSTTTTNPKRSKDTSTGSNSETTQEESLLDDPELDNRILRKCEAVLRWRTNRLLLVIERCTNDHNYSAILRTAEALGIQTIFMIDPPAVSMMDANNNGEDAVSNEADMERLLLRKTEQHQQVKRTAEELEQRR